MKEIKIKHNPYTLETEFEVEGKKVAKNTNIADHLTERFQEWVSEIPKLLVDDCNSTDFDIIFNGTDLDFQDLKSELEKFKDETKNQKKKFNFKLKHIQVKDSNQKLRDLYEVFLKLKKLSEKYNFQDLNIAALEKGIENSFSEKTEVNVVATMSAGKSTLINALLGKKLLTTDSQACTAKIMKIIDNDDDRFSAVAKDSLGKIVKKFSIVTAEDIKEMNNNSNIKEVEIKGNIPFVDSTESSLVLLDSPGTNYSEDKSHEKATLEMIRESPKVLVLFIIDAGNMLTNDQKSLLEAINDSMNSGEDKQLKERFLFVINKMDSTFEDEDPNPQKKIDKVVEVLKKNGIENPNIFPICGRIAFNIRNINNISSLEKKNTNNNIEFINENNVLHLEKYSKLPSSNKNKINAELEKAIKDKDIETQALIHSGIRNLEEAISVFVTKYSRPAKINILQKALKGNIESAESINETIEKIPTEENKLKEYKKKIIILKEQLSSEESNKEFKEKIKNLNITYDLNNSLDCVKGEIELELSVFRDNLPEKIMIDKLNEKILSFQNILFKQQKSFDMKTKELLKENIERTSQKLLEEYINKLNKISKEINIGEIKLSSYIQSELNLIKSTANEEEILKNKQKAIEYYTVSEIRQRAWYNPMRYIDDEFYIENITKSKDIEFILRETFDKKIYFPVKDELNNEIDRIKEYGEEQANNIKKQFSEKFDKVDGILRSITDNLVAVTNSSKDLADKIEESNKIKAEINKIKEELNKILKLGD